MLVFRLFSTDRRTETVIGKTISIVGDSIARYLLLTSFNNSNPYPDNFPSYIRSIYVQNNAKKVHSVLNNVKSKSQGENHE